MKELTDEELMVSTPEEQAFWLNCVKGLPGLAGFSGTGYDAQGVRIPWGSGPHNLKAYRDIVEMVKPKSILEIGFNIGYSSAMWLNLCDCKVVSVEISDKAETIDAADKLFERFGGRIHVMIGDSGTEKMKYDVSVRKYDMIFIDGGHLEENVMADIKLAQDLNIPWIALDDWIPRFGPGVQAAAAKFPLELVLELGNTALLKWK